MIEELGDYSDIQTNDLLREILMLRDVKVQEMIETLEDTNALYLRRQIRALDTVLGIPQELRDKRIKNDG